MFCSSIYSELVPCISDLFVRLSQCIVLLPQGYRLVNLVIKIYRSDECFLRFEIVKCV